jgi:hypothetical protein
MAIERRANSRDSSGGAIIAISPLADTDAFLKGMSGGATVINGRPIAMLTEVDSETGMGIALRFDVIATELEKLGRHSQKSSLPDEKLLAAFRLSLARLPQSKRGQPVSCQRCRASTGSQARPYRPAGQGAEEVRHQRHPVEGAIGPNVPMTVEVADRTARFLFARKCETSETNKRMPIFASPD